MSEEVNELTVQPNPSALTDWNPGEFAAALDNESAKRTALEGYIKSHLKDGVDFGTIKFGGKEGKPTLFKPGAEKVASLLKLRPSFRADGDTLKMLGEVGTGLVAFICTLSTASGEVVAEGRGSAGPEKQDVNTRIKIAEKRAMMDAVLRVAALSDHFTQDLDDMEPPVPKAAAPAPRPAPAPAQAAAPRPAAPAKKPMKKVPKGETPRDAGIGDTGIQFPMGKNKGNDLADVPFKTLYSFTNDDPSTFWENGYAPFSLHNCQHGKYADKNMKIREAIMAVLEEADGEEKPAAPAPAPAAATAPAQGDLNLDEIPF